jgi:hypothetical protein
MREKQYGGDNRVEIEKTVVTYLGNHPLAADTLDGIVAWWLPQQRYETARTRIEQALVHLVEVGVLRCDRLPDGAELYALKGNAPPTNPTN